MTRNNLDYILIIIVWTNLNGRTLKIEVLQSFESVNVMNGVIISGCKQLEVDVKICETKKKTELKIWNFMNTWELEGVYQNIVYRHIKRNLGLWTFKLWISVLKNWKFDVIMRRKFNIVWKILHLTGYYLMYYGT